MVNNWYNGNHSGDSIFLGAPGCKNRAIGCVLNGGKGHMAHKELQGLIREHVQMGWAVTEGKNSYRWQAPNGAFFFSSKTPSDGRAIQNIKSQIKRAARMPGQKVH